MAVYTAATMSDKTKAQKTMTVGKRIFVVILILAGVSIGMLKLAEGSKDALRMGLEDYLVKTTGHPSEITSLKKSELFPTIDFRAEGIIVRDAADKNKTLVTIDEATFAMPFWKRFFGIADYKALSFRKVAIATGYALPKKIELDFAGISASGDLSVPAFFILDGRYNNRNLLLTAEMRRHGDKNPTFDFGSAFPVTFKIGESEAMGVLERSFGKTSFKELELVSNGEKAILNIPNISVDPVEVPFTGEMEDVKFKGILSRNNDNAVLTIDALSGNVNRVKNFVSAFTKDLGFEDKDLKIIINNPDAQAQKEPGE